MDGSPNFAFFGTNVLDVLSLIKYYSAEYSFIANITNILCKIKNYICILYLLKKNYDYNIRLLFIKKNNKKERIRVNTLNKHHSCIFHVKQEY